MHDSEWSRNGIIMRAFGAFEPGKLKGLQWYGVWCNYRPNAKWADGLVHLCSASALSAEKRCM